jgi:hypothetical protein
VIAPAEMDESNRHLRDAWQLYARASPGGEAFERNGLAGAIARRASLVTT